jgi:tRNA G18 (ribose-2'-O)-methylase SpoU
MRKLNITELQRLSVDEFKQSSKMPLVVVLDDVRSMYNVGSVFRTSDAYRVECIYLCGITGCPPHAEIHKTALGAEDSVDWLYFESAEDAVEDLKRRGYKVFAVEQAEGSIGFPLPDDFMSDLPTGYAVVFGNEVKGVKQEVIDRCDGCIELPQYGTKHSLNVATTAGIVIWEYSKLLHSVF